MKKIPDENNENYNTKNKYEINKNNENSNICADVLIPRFLITSKMCKIKNILLKKDF